MLVITVVASLVDVVNVVTIAEVVIVDVASGTKEDFVTVADLVKVLVITRADGVENFVKMQVVGLMVLVVTDFTYFTQLTNAGYTFGEYTTDLFSRVMKNFFFEALRLFFLGTYDSLEMGVKPARVGMVEVGVEIVDVVVTVVIVVVEVTVFVSITKSIIGSKKRFN